MADNILFPFEGLRAGVAGEEPLSTVDVFLVDLQVVAVSEGLLAGLAAIDDICFHSMVRAGRESIDRLQQYQNMLRALSAPPPAGINQYIKPRSTYVSYLMCFK